VALGCERDGWRWEVAVGAGRPAGEAWLSAPSGGRAVVAWEPGRVRLAPGRYDREPEGDPADFALSWAELLDRAALGPPGVVAVGERAAAGAGRTHAPRRTRGPARPAGEWPAALLSALAALLSLAALGLGGRR
jgi:hypothetical protein